MQNTFQAQLDYPNQLGALCVEMYSDHVYFEMPVLSLASLDAAHIGSHPSLGLGSMLYIALITSCIPWLDEVSLARGGFGTREDALQYYMETFDVSGSTPLSPMDANGEEEHVARAK